MALSNWMADYQDRQLGRIHMPGSHDAGTQKHELDLTTFGTNSNAATQELDFVGQLNVGTRFFDLRLEVHTPTQRVVAHHTTAGQGAYSLVGVDRVLKDVAVWCRGHRTEVVIIRISHTSASTNVDQIIRNSVGTHGVLHTGTGNLCTKTLAQITAQGGGLICILDQKKFASAIDQTAGIHSYTKYSNAANANGIATCGCYSGTHALHNVVSNGLKGQYDHNVKHGHVHEHLWQVYWQKTYTNPASTTGIETGTKKALSFSGGKVHGGTHAGTDYMLNLMQGLGPTHGETYKVATVKKKWYEKDEKIMYSTLAFRNFSLPNIVSYDFVNRATNQRIVDMNLAARQAVPVAA